MRCLSQEFDKTEALRKNLDELHKIYQEQCQRSDDIKQVSKGQYLSHHIGRYG